MDSQTEVSRISLFERVQRHRDLSLFLPFIIGLPDTNTRRGFHENQSPDGEIPSSPHTNERIVLINPLTQEMVVLEGTSSLDYLLSEFGNKDGQPPASRASIEAMQSVKIESDSEECVICKEDLQPGGVAKVMPCKHRFHPQCIEKWLGIHGSCPVCRYKMPVEEDVSKKRRNEREFWVSFTYNGGVRNRDSDQSLSQNPSSDSSDSMSGSNSDYDTEY